MMRRLKILFSVILPSLLALSCKSTRPTVEIQEKPYVPPASTGVTGASPTVTSPVDDVPAATLKVSDLVLPAGAKSYTRISLTLALEGSVARNIENYALNDVMALQPYKTYTLTVRVYSSGILIYSNEYCTTGKDFKAKLGPNAYIVPLCAAPSEGDVEENVPAPTATQMTPSSP